ncbi:MAG: DUF1549 domain-containing protein [Planctomycetales bacterium]|nr:DUF1549 domain-containing protein [Planctomycetales bacterium]
MIRHRNSCTLAIVIAALIGQRATVADADDAQIDSILATAHRAAGIVESETCENLTFLRRVSLDLIGRVPTVDEIKQFESKSNRADVVDELIRSDAFPRYWSQLWTTVLVGRGTSNQSNREALRRWMEIQLRENKPLDQIAFDLISAEGVTALDGPVNFLVANRDDPVTPVSRIFLGVQLDCARCHDHPQDRWTQDDYVAMRQFFRTIQIREVSGGYELTDSGATGNPRDELPRFLTGARPSTAAWRREMALMTVRCRPFARAMGNRVWQLLMGRGIVDPVDGLSKTSAASVPALHDALADQLRSQGYDLRRLIRTICISDAYARTESQIDSPSQTSSIETFASRRPRPLQPEQLIVSYARILNRDLPSPESLNALATEYTGRAATKSAATDPLSLQRTSQGLLQELSDDTDDAYGDIDSIFLSTLSRRPGDWERERMQDVSASDLMYALLHCNEFVFCH